LNKGKNSKSKDEEEPLRARGGKTMLKVLILILIIIPALEIWGLVTAGQAFGWIPTMLMVIFTGVAGAWLARQQGVFIFQLARSQLGQGQIPGEAILDGLLIFAGGLVLLTPGFFTDALGFLCLLPYTRSFMKLYIKKWLWRNIQNGRISLHGGNFWRW
jgi:UPF0716 protein FxsA